MKIWPQLVDKVAREKEEVKNLAASFVVSDSWIWDLSWGLKSNSNILVRNYLFLMNYVTSEGALSYYQQLYVACYRVRLYAKNYYE